MKNIVYYIALLCFCPAFAQFNPQNDEITEKFFPDPELDIHTPAFGKKGFTDYDDMMAFLNNLVQQHPDKIALSFIGESQKHKKIPMVVLSHSNGAEKIKVWFQGGLHGDEPAGTETMLFLIDKLLNDPAYTHLLDKITLAVVPMANIDGYERMDRFAANGLDLNRDQVKLQAPESVYLKQAFSDFGAMAAVDFHEYRPYRRDFTNFGTHGMASIYDAMFMFSGNLNLPQDLRDYTKDVFVGNAKIALDTAGLKWHDYITTATIKGDIHFNQGTADARSSTTSYALTNCISSLIEIRGVELGKTSFKRRINTTFIIAASFLKTVYDDSAVIKKIVTGAAQTEADNIVVLSKKHTEKQTIQAIDMKDYTEMSLDITVHNALKLTPVLQRKRPYAYLILPEHKEMADKLKTLGLAVEVLSQKTTVPVEAFTVATSKRKAEEEEGYNEQKVTTRVSQADMEFPEGTYIVYLDQKNARIATEVLEPENENGFIKFEVLKTKVNMQLPVYRYLLNKKYNNAMNLKQSIAIVSFILAGGSVMAQQQDSIAPVTFELGNGLNFNFNNGEYKFKISGFIQAFYEYQKQDGMEADNTMNAKRAYLSVSGSLLNDKISFLLQNDYSRSKSLLDAWVAYAPVKQLKFTFGQKQTFTNNREMTFFEDKLQFTDRGLFSTQFSDTGREFGLFAEAEVALGNFIIRPKAAVTSGDGINSFGSDSRDVDNGGLKYGGRLDILPLGRFKPGNDGYIADLLHEDSVKILAGAAFSYNNGASSRVGEGHGDFLFYNYKGEEQYPDYRKFYGDLLLKYKGFSILGEYVNASALALIGSYVNAAATSPLYPTQISQYMVLGDAFNVQAGYATLSGYSVDVRYEKLTPEFDLGSSLLVNQEAYTLGLAKYFKGNNLKLQTSFTSYKIDDTNTFAAQLLLQVVF